MNKNCKFCQKEFRVYPYQEKAGIGKYCSKPCADKSRIGKPSWNAGMGKTRICLTCEIKYPALGERGKRFCSRACMMKNPEWRRRVVNHMKSFDKTGEKNNRWNGGKPKCKNCGSTVYYGNDRCRKCMGLQTRGENNAKWKGGSGTLRHQLMGQIEYRIWRKSVFERDNYTCQICGVRGLYLQADHIDPWSLYPEKRYDVNNGRTLCVSCHRQTKTWGYNVFNNKNNDNNVEGRWSLRA